MKITEQQRNIQFYQSILAGFLYRKSQGEVGLEKQISIAEEIIRLLKEGKPAKEANELARGESGSENNVVTKRQGVLRRWFG